MWLMLIVFGRQGLMQDKVRARFSYADPRYCLA
jgi:hypothetical protein